MRHNILCIDDRPPFLQLRKAALESLGYSVAVASSTGAAITLLQETAVSVVLMEYKSEGMDAEAAAFHLKQRFPQLPIILLSAYSDMPERILWLVDEYVMRSASIDGLAEAIERVIGKTQSAIVLKGRAEAA